MSENRITFLIVAAILSAVVLACDGASRLSGHVYDVNDQPIANAKILFEDADAEKSEHPEYFQNKTETNGFGSFSTGITHAPFDIRLRLTVTKEGYRPYVAEFKASDATKMNEDKHEMKIVLEKEIQN